MPKREKLCMVFCKTGGTSPGVLSALTGDAAPREMFQQLECGGLCLEAKGLLL